MRIAIYGTGNYAMHLMKEIEGTEEVEIAYFVESTKSKDSFAGREVISSKDFGFDDFDKLVVAYHDYNEIISYLKEHRLDYEVNKDKIVDMIAFVPSLKESRTDIIPYKSISLSCGLKYVYANGDLGIGGAMATFDENFSEKLINAFFEMTDKYYGKKNREGYFFDIGANIGTTSIYVKKKCNPKLHVIGIEAGKDNYDLFRVNCILNKCEDIVAVNKGIGETEGKGTFHYNPVNPGGSAVLADTTCTGEMIDIISLKKYCDDNKIGADSIDYIWIDTEGFEAAIIEGAKDILKHHTIPLIHEYNPGAYRANGQLDRYYETISEIYSSFIDADEYMVGKEDVRHSISELPEWTEKMQKIQADLFFI